MIGVLLMQRMNEHFHVALLLLSQASFPLCRLLFSFGLGHF
jgi:hypothetical protein